jgi:DUF1680 family protein
VLPPSYTNQNQAFLLRLGGFEPRFISPHPYAKQDTLSLARGPILYCVEDYDNSWENNHFRNLEISADAVVQEEQQELNGEKYRQLRSKGSVRNLTAWTEKKPGHEPGAAVSNFTGSQKEERELVFIPYYLRANRGGNGHMRVGLLRG